MLSPDELNNLAIPAEKIQMQLQRDTTRRIAEIIAKHGELTASGQHLLNRLQITRFNADYQADIAKYAKMTEAEIGRIIFAAKTLILQGFCAIISMWDRVRGLTRRYSLPFSHKLIIRETTN